MEKKVINTQKAPAAIGPYSQAIQFGNLLFISGQLPINPETGDLLEGDIKEQTRQCMKNIKAICEEAGATLDDIVKTTIFVKDLNLFGDINEAYGEFFKEKAPARACVEVARIPKDAKVEIEAIVGIK